MTISEEVESFLFFYKENPVRTCMLYQVRNGQKWNIKFKKNEENETSEYCMESKLTLIELRYLRLCRYQLNDSVSGSIVN